MSEEKKHGAEHLAAWKWQKGKSGNPKGRPRRPAFETIVGEILDEKLSKLDLKKLGLPEEQAQSKREALARLFVNELFQKNGALLKEFLARAWPVTQVIDVTITESDGTGPHLEPFETEAEILAAKTNGKGSETLQ